MALNKNKKDNLKTALFYLQGGYKNKPEITENAGQRVEIKFDTAFASKDEELLRKLADEVFCYLKDYPELMLELKEKYFKNL